MNNKKWYILAVLFLLGALFLSACGGTDLQLKKQPTNPPTTTDTSRRRSRRRRSHGRRRPWKKEEAADEEEAWKKKQTKKKPDEEEAMEEFDVSITVWADDTRAPSCLSWPRPSRANMV